MAVSAEALERAVLPVVAGAGLDLEGVEVRPAGRRTLVRVIVDADGGVSLDAVAAVSGPVSEALDASGALGESAYTLEVTSPGVDRPLTEERHWRRAVGRLVQVTPVEGAPFTGRLVAVSGTDAELDVDGEVRVARMADVRRAVVQVEFSDPAGRAGEA